MLILLLLFFNYTFTVIACNARLTTEIDVSFWSCFVRLFKFMYKYVLREQCY